ncbi:MAG: transposase [Pseudomonadota bacterium]
MLLAHRIRIDPTDEQRSYFFRAAGTSRRTWNWGLDQWQRQLAAGGKPNAYALKRQFNAIKYSDPEWLDEDGLPWLKTMHRDSHAQPFTYLGRAMARYDDDVKNGRPAHPPRFKKKGRCPDSFYVANDKFRIKGHSAVLPKVGRVALSESLRLDGKIMGATVIREAGHWTISIQVDVPDARAQRKRTADGIVGVDLGISSAATMSTGEKVDSPRPLRRDLRRLRIRSRKVSHKLTAEKDRAGIQGAIPKGTRLPVSRNRIKAQEALARQHARIAAKRCDFTHKLTTRLCRENQTVVIEDLNVKGMMKNHRLARAISDVGFGRISRQLAYKAPRYGTQIIVADRWYPSSKLCSACGWKHARLSLGERSWRCSECGTDHDRDHNAAINLQRLATGAAVNSCGQTALPVASRTATSGTASGKKPHAGLAART